MSGDGSEGEPRAAAASETASHGTTTSTARDWLGIYLRGVFMGAADTVPGVSGGTIALITGIYERLITAITNVDFRLLDAARGLPTAEGRDDFRDLLVDMDVPFVVVLGLGIVTAVVTIARVLEVALTSFRGPTFAFFFGLIAASAWVLYDEVDVRTPRRVAVSLLGVAVALVLTTSGVRGALPTTPLVVVVAGGVAITAMILPGISGSFILLLLGQYDYVFGAISGAVDALLARDLAALVDASTVVVAFGIGAVVGILSVARVIRYALTHYRAATLTFLVSLMVGSLRLPLVEVLRSTDQYTTTTVVSLVAIGVVGAGAVVALDRFTDDFDYDADGR